ncbi:MAG TPA: hypothetical protein PKN36_05815 [bacterium]|nr:hypothetical protein [bacterium]
MLFRFSVMPLIIRSQSAGLTWAILCSCVEIEPKNSLSIPFLMRLTIVC